MEAVLTGLLIDAATSTAVDVLSRRTVSPRVKMAARLWRVYSVSSKAVDIYGAWRIAAYSDAAGLIAGEIVVDRLSKEVSATMPQLDGINFALIERAEGLLLEPDFTVQIAHNPNLLNPIWMVNQKPNVIDKELTAHGGELAGMTAPCVEHGARANATVQQLLRYPECQQPRRIRRWIDKARWTNGINVGLGYALYRPIPEIGLGARSLSNVTSYNGVFRHETAEGYGRITWTNGDAYFGQVRDGWERGYGLKLFADGTVLVGYFNDMHASLGVSISPQRDRAFYGAHRGGKLFGYGRQIGLRNGVESVSGFWDESVLRKALQFMPSIYQKQVETLSRTRRIVEQVYPARGRDEKLEEMIADYSKKAADASGVLEGHDQTILSFIREFT